ncbi:MAG: hydrogenase maturation protease [Chloroflexota bacterium]
MTAGRGVVVVGYGNPLRGDDGVGWRVAESLLADPRLAGAHVMTVHQLLPELASELGEAALAVLIDAKIGESPGSISVAQVTPSPDRSAWTHHLTPAVLAGLARQVAGRSADVVVVSIGIASTEPDPGLTREVADAVSPAREVVAELVLAHA